VKGGFESVVKPGSFWPGQADGKLEIANPSTDVLGEETSVAVTRYLSRTIGALLANITNDDQAAAGLLKKSVNDKIQVKAVDALIELSRKAIKDAQSISDASDKMLHRWERLANKDKFYTQEALSALVEVLRKSCEELAKSLIERSTSGSGTEGEEFKTKLDTEEIFGSKRSKSINISMIRGSFVGELEKVLRPIAETCRQEKGGASEVVSLSINSASGEQWGRFFHIEPKNLAVAYFKAALQYALRRCEEEREPR